MLCADETPPACVLTCDLLFFFFLFFQALEWIHDTGEFYLSTHTSTGSSIHHTQELLKEHEDFQITAKVCLYNDLKKKKK